MTFPLQDFFWEADEPTDDRQLALDSFLRYKLGASPLPVSVANKGL